MTNIPNDACRVAQKEAFKTWMRSRDDYKYMLVVDKRWAWRAWQAATKHSRDSADTVHYKLGYVQGREDAAVIAEDSYNNATDQYEAPNGVEIAAAIRKG